MKKIFVIALSCFIFMIISFNSYSYASNRYDFMTTDGIGYNADEIIVYDYELLDAPDTQEGLIDYFYSIGYNRVETCDLKYNAFGHVLTKNEIKLNIKYFWFAKKGYQASKDAISKTAELFGYTTDDSKANAFQHAYWVALMYFRTSPYYAIEEAKAHEEYDSNEEMSKHMDLYNDNRGYEACESYEHKSDEELADYIYSLVTDGKLKYIIRNYQYVKEKIYYITSGRTDYIYASGDFFCFTNSDTPYGVPAAKERKSKYEIMEGLVMEA